ncbi:hypothetical protein CUZ56_02769 [Saezia sanguinis]|uniref:UPF0301 protein CUZ56_02769 n=1 Tax=Saezia sanguinis TaxID=1965230 RepID=A0A433SAB2_9BURK|nr:YqgE/AlgH family protein [Saezia sanguinis]RUS65683.1 hypothetical protein CUZ56_02769 [Saezia sanguinis]
MGESSPLDLTNHFLIAMPGMLDDSFSQGIIYLCEHNAQGALGLVINKPVDISLQQLFDKVDLPLADILLQDNPVYYGGPVQTERGFVLHDPMMPITDDRTLSYYNATLHVPDGLDMTSSKDVLEDIATGKGPQRFLVTLGYAGWGAGQLEEELARNSWLTVRASPEIIFDTPAPDRYVRTLALLGIQPEALVGIAGHA